MMYAMRVVWAARCFAIRAVSEILRYALNDIAGVGLRCVFNVPRHVPTLLCYIPSFFSVDRKKKPRSWRGTSPGKRVYVHEKKNCVPQILILWMSLTRFSTFFSMLA